MAASPALGALGGLSWLTLGSTALAQKVLLAAAPALAAILAYRAAVRLTGRPGPSVLAAAAYLVSGLVLWAFSEGDLGLLVALAVLPAVFERVESAFAAEEPSDGRWRFIAGTGVTIAVLVAFLPGAALAVALLVIVQVVAGASRGRGLSLILSAVVVAAALLFPFVPTLVAGDGAALAGYLGTTDLASLVRLAPGGGPGTWVVAAFLPVAAFVSFALVGAEHRGRAVRAAVAAVAALGMSWLAAAGWLPEPLSDPLAYLAVAATSEAMLVAYGVSSAVTGLGREAFGLRQVLTGMLVVTLGGGLLLQAVAVLVGGWAVGEPAPDRVPPAWSVVESRAQGDFRVLWLGAGRIGAFPPPGGEPQCDRGGGGGDRPIRPDRPRGRLGARHRSAVRRTGARSARRGTRRDPVRHDTTRRGAPRPIRGALRRRGDRRPLRRDEGVARRAGRSRSDPRVRAARVPERRRDAARRHP